VLARLRRALLAAAARLDHAAGRKLTGLRVLVEVRTPMNLAVLAPVWRALLADGVDVRFTGPALARADVAAAFANAAIEARVVARARARLLRWDLYMNADPWDPVPLLRCRRRINFFHGVAGKYNLDCPVGLPLALDTYDRVAFPNAGRMQRYIDAGLVRPERAALVGFPKLDALVNARVAPRQQAAALGLDAGAPTAIYAPTFSPESSLQTYGEAIVRRLLSRGFNTIVKLHDRSLDPDPKYSGGQDWRARFSALAPPSQLLFATAADSTPYLLASELMVTDHSTIGFEFIALDRPLIVFDVPRLLTAARVEPGKVALLRDAADVVRTMEELETAAERAVADPGLRAEARLQAVAEVFHDPGTATARAVAVCCELLECAAPAPQRQWSSAAG
jgi:hypothetical protein